MMTAALGLLAASAAAPQGAVQDPRAPDPHGLVRQLAEARRQGAEAAARAAQLEAASARASAAADRSAAEAAALAARIQQGQAAISADLAQIALLQRQREALRARIAAREAPLLRLTAALQLLARRPLTTALLRPGSLADAVHLRVLLATVLPAVAQRTAALRQAIARGQQLQREAGAAAQALAHQQILLRAQRQRLTELETSQRLAARAVSGNADQAAEHALTLAEQTRDLAALVAALGSETALADRLAALDGPVLCPVSGSAPAPPTPGAPPPVAASLGNYALPVAGRLVGGFSAGEGAITLAATPGAQAVAPAAGQVAFAGPYHGYGAVVIIDHGGGWVSVVTGLAALDVRTGDRLIAGAPLGVAGPGSPTVGLQLRENGTPVDPLEHLTR